MQSWLDWHVADRFATKPNPDQGFHPTLAVMIRAFGSVAQEPFDYARQGLLIEARVGEHNRLQRIESYRRLLHHHVFVTSLLPFFRRADDPADGVSDRECRAVRLTAELLEDLSKARAPDAVTDLWRGELDKAWYLDFPHRGLLLGEGLQLRALFAGEIPHEGAWAVAILTAPGSDRNVSRIAWRIGSGGGWHRNEPDVRVLGARVSEQGDASLDDLLVFGEVPPFDADYFREAVESLLALTILYATTRDTAAPGEMLPRITPEALSANPRKAAQKAKKFSLFAIRHLASPPDRFGRVRVAGRRWAGWRLDVRQEVRGFFRMQAHGPRHSLRRLQWIDGYERGPGDGRVRAEMQTLDREGEGA